MGKVTERRMARAGAGWEADPIESGFDAPCRQCGEIWPVETMGLGEDGRTCPLCETDANLTVANRQLTHETVWQVLLVDAPAIGLGLWLAAGVLPPHALFLTLVWTLLCVGQALRGWSLWRQTSAPAALVALGAGMASALVASLGIVVFAL